MGPDADHFPGIFELIACVMIFVMGVTMLKMDRAKVKWRVKLQRAFEGKGEYRFPRCLLISYFLYSVCSGGCGRYSVPEAGVCAMFPALSR